MFNSRRSSLSHLPFAFIFTSNFSFCFCYSQQYLILCYSHALQRHTNHSRHIQIIAHANLYVPSSISPFSRFQNALRLYSTSPSAPFPSSPSIPATSSPSTPSTPLPLSSPLSSPATSLPSASSSSSVPSTTNYIHLLPTATKHITTLLKTSIKPTQKTILLYDKQCGLTDILAQAYQQSLEGMQTEKGKMDFEAIDFDQTSPENILNKFAQLSEGDLVVLVETTSFRLSDYRIRIELFKRGIKNVEHVHLGLIDEIQYPAYIESLYFNPVQCGPLSRHIKQQVDSAKHIVVECDNTKLEIKSEMEPALLNIGDYEGMKNTGGTFPIGEVFSEPKDLTKINGELMVFGYPNTNYKIETHKPFKVSIKDGFLEDIPETDTTVPESFKTVVNIIKTHESNVVVREFGLGLNDAMGKDRPVNDGTSFERQKGLHFSLGKKHNVYKKPGMKNGRFHVDMFVDVRRIIIDGKVLYENGDFCAKQ